MRWRRRDPMRVYSDTAHVRDPGLALVVDDPSDDPTPPDSEEIVWQLAEKRAGELAAERRQHADYVFVMAKRHDALRTEHDNVVRENARLRQQRDKLAEHLEHALPVVDAAVAWRAVNTVPPQALEADYCPEELALIAAVDARTSRLADGGTT